MISTIFENVENADENIEFSIAVSYVEVYMERVRDLINPSKQNLQVRRS